mgnify:CR=1 FL=1
MRLYLLFISAIFLSILFSCKSSNNGNTATIQGKWRSLWEKDMTLRLELDTTNTFKVILTRTGQVHTNIGWYDTEGDVFILKDSLDFPLPVCNLTDTGRYNFTIHKDTLTFKVIDDVCDRRASALQLERFVRVQ